MLLVLLACDGRSLGGPQGASEAAAPPDATTETGDALSEALPPAPTDAGADAPPTDATAEAGHTMEVGPSADASEVRVALCRLDPPTSCPQPAVRYVDVAPIIAQRCLSCHNGQMGHWPLTSYEHVADWQDTIRAVMLDCSMPPAEAQLPMPVEERQALLLWVRCGALP